MQTKTQPEIITRAIAGAVRSLQAIGCKFFVESPDGTITQSENFTVKSHTKTRTHAPGELKAVYAPLVDVLEVGGVAVIPCPLNIDPEAMRSSVTAYLSNKWGNGSYQSCVDKRDVQILRLS